MGYRKRVRVKIESGNRNWGVQEFVQLRDPAVVPATGEIGALGENFGFLKLKTFKNVIETADILNVFAV